VIGSLTIRRTDVRPFTDKQIAQLQRFADQAVIVIENIRLFEEVQARTQELARSVAELKALSDVSQAVNASLDLARCPTVAAAPSTCSTRQTTNTYSRLATI
jgi:GAF domain-containing protein